MAKEIHIKREGNRVVKIKVIEVESDEEYPCEIDWDYEKEDYCCINHSCIGRCKVKTWTDPETGNECATCECVLPA